MAVIYDFYETPVPDGQEKKGELHVRVLPRQTVNSEELAKTIHQRSTFMESEVGAVINLLRNLIVEKLKDGDLSACTFGKRDQSGIRKVQIRLVSS